MDSSYKLYNVKNKSISSVKGVVCMDWSRMCGYFNISVCYAFYAYILLQLFILCCWPRKEFTAHALTRFMRTISYYIEWNCEVGWIIVSHASGTRELCYSPSIPRLVDLWLLLFAVLYIWEGLRGRLMLDDWRGFLFSGWAKGITPLVHWWARKRLACVVCVHWNRKKSTACLYAREFHS